VPLFQDILDELPPDRSYAIRIIGRSTNFEEVELILERAPWHEFDARTMAGRLRGLLHSNDSLFPHFQIQVSEVLPGPQGLHRVRGFDRVTFRGDMSWFAKNKRCIVRCEPLQEGFQLCFQLWIALGYAAVAEPLIYKKCLHGRYVQKRREEWLQEFQRRFPSLNVPVCSYDWIREVEGILNVRVVLFGLHGQLRRLYPAGVVYTPKTTPVIVGLC
jgi:hypothetical protein